MTFRGHGALSVSWWGAEIPTTGPTGTASIWVGNELGFEVDGWVAGFRCFVDNTRDGNYLGILWRHPENELVVAKHFRIKAVAADDWHQTWIRPRYKVQLNQFYRLAVLYYNGTRFQTNNALIAPVQRNNITFTHGWTSTAIAPQLATLTMTANAMAVDVLFDPA